MVVEVHFGDTSGSKTLSSTLTNYSWTTFVYNTNWSIVHPLFWNYFHVSFNNWGSMSWKTNTSDMSYVNMTYKYGAYPVVKDLSNPLINVLSATMPDDESSAQIIVEGEDWTNMTVVMPGSVEDVYYDGIQHNLTGNCNATIRGSTVYIDLAVGSEHNISITTPSAEEGGLGVNLGNTKNILMQKGVPKFIEFYNPNLPVVGVEVVLNEGVLLDLEVRRVPDSYIVDRLENSYAYFELKSSLSNSYFDSIIITFKVKKEFDDIKLYKLSNTWDKIDITQIYEDSKYNYYQAVGSLGYFAVTGEQIEFEKQETTSVKSGPKEEVIKNQVIKSGINWNSFFGAFLLLNLLVVVFLFYKDKMFSKRIKIFGSVLFSLLALFFVSQGEITSLSVYTSSSVSFV